MIFHHNISPTIFSAGPFELQWYGILFASGLAVNYLLLMHIFKERKLSLKHLDSLLIWMFVGLVLGARLGHVFFYDASLYLSQPLEILKIWEGGLASHGAAIGLFLAYFGWCKKSKVSFSKYINFLVVPMPLTAAFVRVGNFINSEIVGYPTESSSGVVFERLGEDFARHPVQLYSAWMNLFIFVVLFLLYKRSKTSTLKLNMLFIYLFLYFVGRFTVEFWKDLQGPVPESFGITTGQALSILPITIAVGYFVINALIDNKKSV